MSYIEFPKLGIKFNIDNVAFSIFGFEVFWYGVIIASGIFLAVVLALRVCKRFNIIPDQIIDIMLYCTPAAIITARLYYVIFNFGEYDSFIDIINIRKGGLAIYGGIIGAFVSAAILAKLKKINIMDLFDMGAPYIALAQAVGRWGNFVNQEAFGSNTNLPWGMTGSSIKIQLSELKDSGINVSPDLPVHPAFLYESLWNLLTFGILIWFRKKNVIKGRTFFLYMILYGIGRIWIEGLRMDSLMMGPFRISQVIALLFIIVFTIIFIKYTRNNNQENMDLEHSAYYDILKNDSNVIDGGTIKGDKG